MTNVHISEDHYPTAQRVAPWESNPYGLVSLWDMLSKYSFSFYEVVIRLERLRNTARIYADGAGTYAQTTNVPKAQLEELSKSLGDMRKECVALMLSDTASLLSFFLSELFQKGEAYTYADMLKDVNTLNFSFSTGLRKRFFFGLDDEKKRYFQNDDVVAPQVNSAFPLSTAELKHAGDCYALEHNEACVYYCMCALEVALHVLANELSVTFSGTLDLQNWQNIIETIEAEIKKLTNLPPGRHKSETLKFLSGAAMQFRWFKDAWRNHVMHGRDIYDPGRAFSVFDHVREFMQALADGGLKE